MVESESSNERRSFPELPRGVFTDADRRYLKCDPAERNEEYTPAADYERRKAISKRLSAAVYDLSTALRTVSPEVRKDAFNGAFIQAKMWLSFNLITNTIAFLLLGHLEERNKDLDDDEHIEKVVEQSIDRMLWHSGQRVATNTGKIDVDISIEEWQTSNEYQKNMPLEQLGKDDLEWLFRMGEISHEEFARGILSDKDNNN